MMTMHMREWWLYKTYKHDSGNLDGYSKISCQDFQSSRILIQTPKGQSWVLQLVDIELTSSSCEARHKIMHMLFDVVKISLMCC